MTAYLTDDAAKKHPLILVEGSLVYLSEVRMILTARPYYIEALLTAHRRWQLLPAYKETSRRAQEG